MDQNGRHIAQRPQWIVGLDLSSMDEPLISYVDFLARILNPQSVHFVHIEEKLAFPSAIQAEFPDISHPAYTEVKAKVAARVKQYFHAPVSHTCEVLEGDPIQELLRWPVLKQADLAILGWKGEWKASGILPQKITRKAACSVLFVPEEAELLLHKILVPIDFSAYSAHAMEAAIELAAHHPGCEILCWHAYKDADWYLNLLSHGASAIRSVAHDKEHLSIRLETALQETLSQFLQPYQKRQAGISGQLFARSRYGSNLGRQILEAAAVNHASLILMGARGLSPAASILLGSTSEKVIHHNHRYPLLVIKDTEGHRRLLKAVIEQP